MILSTLMYEDLDDDLAAQDSIFESDAAAMKSFIRELVTQSIVPFMESRIVTWNDQIASKRRGIGGRFMSLSKKWTGFGSSRGSNSTTAAGPSSSNSNFDPAKGFYPPESPEAIMRQLADYSFMLGDFKLAFSTYDTLRTDFSNDKAWLYHASACEFACVSYLLIPQTLSNRSRAEMVDQKLDAALFSYLTRSSVAMGAVRSILLTVELSGGKGPAAAADAAKWATRLLDLGILTPLPQALLTERIADIYRSQGGSGSLRLGSRRRHAILWNTLASTLWAKLDRSTQASVRLRVARTIQAESSRDAADWPFPTMRPMNTYLGQEGNDTEDEALIEFDTDAGDTHHPSTTYETNERPDEHSTLSEPQPPDAGGFSTVEANHPGFETVK